ncbi:MAG: DUF418 domain-containing protein [Rhizobiales bacterium]|nr:DUF1624 domain-containing protein [Hyphomicrobiales bacterium]NRB12966.1 DUF418 domain-containing protein [Hyphomicrobiales bacterium]
MNQDKHKLGRIAGLDFARFIAFTGMVFVNFKIAMLPLDANLGAIGWFFGLLEGRAAALFVILAGIGLGLNLKITQLNRQKNSVFAYLTVKRGLFLFAIGMLNAVIFEADILHYYGVYFIFAAFLAPLSSARLRVIIVAIMLAATIMLLVFNFDEGWNWQTYEYTGFYTLSGGIRNLFYNGWHPVLPWMAFLLIGILLSRVNLVAKKVQLKMILGGIGITLIGYLISVNLVNMLFSSNDAELSELIPLVSMGPVPATLLYMMSATGTACAVIAAAIIIAKKFASLSIVKAINIAGRQTLTLYFAHIYLAMGLMNLFDLLGQFSVNAMVMTALAFTIISSVYSNIWANYFKLGPLEMLMRKIAG